MGPGGLHACAGPVCCDHDGAVIVEGGTGMARDHHPGPGAHGWAPVHCGVSTPQVCGQPAVSPVPDCVAVSAGCAEALEDGAAFSIENT